MIAEKLPPIVSSGRPDALRPHPHVERRGDFWVVRGTRIPVCRLFDWHRKGVTVETLLRRYPALRPAELLDALSFAYDFPELVAREGDSLADR